MTFDHGILNLPLSKRCNIDAEIDKYKARQAKEAKAARKASAEKNRKQKAEAKAALASLVAIDGLIDAKAKKLGITSKALMARLDSLSKWEPAKLIKLHSEWLNSSRQS